MELQVINEKRQELGEVAFVRDTSNQVRIRDIKDSYEVAKQLALFIGVTCELLGIKEEMNVSHKRDVKDLILGFHGSLSFDELHYAFKLERFGRLGEKSQHYQLFGSDYVSDVLKKYIEWKRQVKVENNITANRLPEPPSEQEKQRIRRQFLRNVYDDIKDSGHCPDAWLLYDELEKSGKLVVGDSRKKEVYQKELNKYLEELKANITKRHDLKHQVAKLRQDHAKGNYVAEVKNRSKALLTCEYLSDFCDSFESFFREIQEQTQKIYQV